MKVIVDMSTVIIHFRAYIKYKLVNAHVILPFNMKYLYMHLITSVMITLTYSRCKELKFVQSQKMTPQSS